LTSGLYWTKGGGGVILAQPGVMVEFGIRVVSAFIDLFGGVPFLPNMTADGTGMGVVDKWRSSLFPSVGLALVSWVRGGLDIFGDGVVLEVRVCLGFVPIIGGLVGGI